MGYYRENVDNRILKSKLNLQIARPINSIEDASAIIRAQLNVKELFIATKMLDERRRKKPNRGFNGKHSNQH